MEQLELLMGGFASALTPINLLWVLIGAVLGTAVGVLPGLGSAMAVALLLPVTFSLEPTAAFILFVVKQADQQVWLLPQLSLSLADGLILGVSPLVAGIASMLAAKVTVMRSLSDMV